MVAILEWTQSNVQQNIEQLQTPTMRVTIKKKSTTTVHLTCKTFLQTVLIYWEVSNFISNNGVLTWFCFLKTMCVLGHQEADFQSSFYAFEC